MLQLCLTSLRTERGLEAFNLVYGDKYKYSLSAWKKAVSLTARETDLLDADNGAGGNIGTYPRERVCCSVERYLSLDTWETKRCS